MNSVFKTNPAVFAVGNEYHIMVPVKVPVVMWVRVGENEYYDDSNGVLRSNVNVHKMVVPMDALNDAENYVICYREIIDRKEYFSETTEIFEEKFSFRPLKSGDFNVYHIADAHNHIEEPIKATRNFEEKYGKIDLLIMNGDIISDSQHEENFYTIYEIVSEITKGELPVVCSRGNHDNRGICAEKIVDYFPSQNENTYYSFKLGDVWGLVLDCGEDKNDDHIAYGNTICSHAFRERQTRFIKETIEKKEYLLEDVKYRLIVVHNPFTRKTRAPFDVDQDIYKDWADMLKNSIKPTVMICGHEHDLDVEYPGGERDGLGHPCPVVVGSWVNEGPKTDGYTFVGNGFVFDSNGIKVVFNDDEGTMFKEYNL